VRPTVLFRRLGVQWQHWFDRSNPSKNLDLVYAAGLYDYLSQPLATRLTKTMFDMLRPGGKLQVANFVPDHPEVGYMETFMQWSLIYRTESQLEDVAKEIPAPEIADKRTFLKTTATSCSWNWSNLELWFCGAVGDGRWASVGECPWLAMAHSWARKRALVVGRCKGLRV